MCSSFLQLNHHCPRHLLARRTQCWTRSSQGTVWEGILIWKTHRKSQKSIEEYKTCINKHLSPMWSEWSTKDSRRQDVYLKVASRAVHVQACLNHSLPELWKSRWFFDMQNICHVDVWDLYLCPNALPPVRRLDVKIFHEHRLSLPRGVREEEKGKANKLQIWSGTSNKCSIG